MKLCNSKAISDITETANKIRTLHDDQIQIILGFCKGSAFLLQRWPERRPTVSFVGPRFVDLISVTTRVTLINRGVEDFAVLVTAGKCRNLVEQRGVIFAVEDLMNESGGCILIYGKPDKMKIHVRLLAQRSSVVTLNSFKIKDTGTVWMIKAICEPLLLSFGMKINWNRLVEEIFAVRYRRITENGENNGTYNS